MQHYDVVIVGAGHGGAQTAIALRQSKFGGTVAMIGDEPEFPYERPPLSKEYLAGEKPFERIQIRPEEFWEHRNVVMHLARRVSQVEPERRIVTMEDGEEFEYGVLVWAAGGAAKSLSCEGGSLPGVHTVRSRADVDQMIDQLPEVSQAVVIGGGYIGLEAAAVLTKLGKHVVLLEALDRVLARVAGEPLSRFYEAEHRAQGVDVRLGAAVDCIEGEDTVSGVRLADGEVIPADMVIVGIGISPSVEPLTAAGARGSNGVLVDAQCRTSLPEVFAIGDCALHSNSFADGELIRLESVQNATDQANVAAKTISGLEASYDAVPWFWSNQYDLRLQTIGLSAGHDASVVRGDPEDRSFSVAYLKSGRVIAFDCVNATKDFVQSRALVVGRRVIDPQTLADARIPLKELAGK